MTVALRPAGSLRQRISRLTLVALVGAAALIQTTALDATADGAPYSVSLNSPVTFPVDI
ncbi:MAG: hypothetical protein OXU96_08985 [Gammaproteobacteria bacterium]|nr:hypothetical protein [Gammaproteobacteria bacterium]MDD9874603.1 hypothetical protein [Gammaproteobacteria bacterium]